MIPPEYRSLVRKSKGKESSICDDCENFVMRCNGLNLPTGQLVTTQQVVVGAALLELGA